MRTVLSLISVHRTVGTGRPPQAMINDCLAAPSAPPAPWAQAGPLLASSILRCVAWALRFRVQACWMTPYFLKSFSRNNNVAIKVWRHFVGINVTIPPFATRAHLANALLTQAHQAVEDVITQYPEGVAIDQCVWRD